MGIECLVIWESEVKQDPAEVAQRIHDFIDRGQGVPALDSEPKVPPVEEEGILDWLK